MKTIVKYITEKLHLKKGMMTVYNYSPKTFKELRSVVELLLYKRGNDANMNDVDVSRVTTFNAYHYGAQARIGLFFGLDPHKIDISQWDVSNVENMSEMFSLCENFDCDLSNWDVSKVRDMNGMFDHCKSFTGKGLEKWNVKNVKYMESMFDGCKSLPKIPSWWDENLQ